MDATLLESPDTRARDQAPRAHPQTVAHTRISKACQECRKRKIRCDGLEPCARCRRRRTNCIYRAVNRRTKKPRPMDSSVDPASESVETEEEAASHEPRTKSSNDNDTRLQPSPSLTLMTERTESINNARLEPIHSLNHQTLMTESNNHARLQSSPPLALTPEPQPPAGGINRSVTATHFASPSCVVQIYYGASSNFAFLQQIHQALSLDAVHHSASGQGEVQEGGAGLDRFGQRALFFGAGETPQHAGGHLRDVPLTFLSLDLAARFLGNYIDTIYALHPFQPPSELKESVKQLYENPQANMFVSGKTAAILSVLAIGATMAEDTIWAEILAEKSKSIATSLSHVKIASELMLTCDPSHAHYESILGRPNSAYLYLGAAVRKAFAAGIHRDATVNDSNGNKSALIQEKRTTIWCLYFYESFVCFSLGRPSSIVIGDISAPYPENQRLIPGLVKLSNIASDAMRQIYGYRQSSLLDMWRAAQNIQRELQGFAFDILERVGINFHKSFQSSKIDIEHIFLHNLYCHTLILTFRPFLVVHLSHQTPRSASAGNSGRVGNISSPLARNLSWLLEACKYAVDAAFSLINFLARAIEVIPAIKGLGFFSFYVEGACFLLIYDILRDQNAKPRNIEGVNMALRFLSNMTPAAMVSSNTLAIQRMLSAIEQIPREPGNEHPSSIHPPGIDPTTIPIGVPSHSTGADMLRLVKDSQFGPLQDAPINFAAGWATYENGPNMCQSGVSELELLDWDCTKINWDFDIFSTDFGSIV